MEPDKQCAAIIQLHDNTNRRCGLDAVHGSVFCNVHRGMLAVENRKREPRYSHLFKHQTLREAYERLLNDPEIADLSEELALSRVLLAGTIAKIEAREMQDMTVDDKAVIAAMLDQVCKAAEAMGKMEKYLQTNISVSQLAAVTEQAARLFYREFVGLITKVRDETNAREIQATIPEVLHRIGVELEQTDVPFSPVRWMKQHDEPPPESSRTA